LRNNNAAYIRNGPRAARLGTRYLDDYNRQLEQYDLDLKAYDAAVPAGWGRAPIRPILPKKPDEAKGEEKELKT
jgi:soluble lytic murein transglycosylase-like protein